MVELVLNLIWVAIAIAISATFLPRQRARSVATIAVACLIALLFPIISISDDLAPARDALAELSPQRRSIAATSSFGQVPSANHPAALRVFVAIAAAIVLTTIDRLDSADSHRRIVLLYPQTDPRSPPSIPRFH